MTKQYNVKHHKRLKKEKNERRICAQNESTTRKIVSEHGIEYTLCSVKSYINAKLN